MKNKLFNKFLSVLLVSFIGLTSISSFNHVSAADFDSSYNKQLVSSGSNVHRTPFMPPTVPGGGNPLTKWIGTLSSLGFVLGIVCGVNVGNTVKVLENGFADQKTSTTFNNIINNSPNFSIEDFANDPDNLSGNYQGLYNKYGSKLNVNSYTLEDLENYNKNLYYNGGNKNYYTNNDYSSNDNYSVFNSSTNNINYTYNNQHYNYTVNNMFYNYVTNEYTFNTTNNQNITYINNYNNTTIISPSGATQKLYYELPDGSNSLNLTEEQAKSIIRSWQDGNSEPGRYIATCKDNYALNKYIAIDNSTNDCWEEEFRTLKGCKKYLSEEMTAVEVILWEQDRAIRQEKLTYILFYLVIFSMVGLLLYLIKI